jgi:tRNA(Ile)-lysidine synthetase-like protein
LGLVATKEPNGITITFSDKNTAQNLHKNGAKTAWNCMIFGQFLAENLNAFGGETFIVTTEKNLEADIKKANLAYPFKILKVDGEKIPPEAALRFFEVGDKFTPFGGGTKKLGDYFTNLKIPQRLRKTIPLLAAQNKILLVGGVEIADELKVTPTTSPDKVLYIVCKDYRNWGLKET